MASRKLSATARLVNSMLRAHWRFWDIGVFARGKPDPALARSFVEH
jgi:hypothetical protein